MSKFSQRIIETESDPVSAAMDRLATDRFEVTNGIIRPQTKGIALTQDEWDAIIYLQDEWDFFYEGIED